MTAEAVVIEADPNAPPPAEEPKPDAPPADAPVEEPKPDEEKPPEPEASAFDKLIEGLTDPDEIEAVIERAREKLPEDRRTPKAEPVDEAQNAIATEQRRRESVRQNEEQRDAAVAKLNGHLKSVKTKLLSNEPGDADYDPDLLTGAINEIVQAEIALADQGARELFSTALSTRLQKHGGALTNERFKEIVKAVAENKVEHGIVGAYLDEFGERRYQTGLAEGEAKAQAKDAAWRRAETAAVRAELMRDKETEPDAGKNVIADVTDQGRLDRLYLGRDATEADRAWLAARN